MGPIWDKHSSSVRLLKTRKDTKYYIYIANQRNKHSYKQCQQYIQMFKYIDSTQRFSTFEDMFDTSTDN